MGQTPSEDTVPTGELVVVSGRYRGRRTRLSSGNLRIGRDRICEVTLDDDATSRIHAEVFYHTGAYMLRDLNSTNGTFLNDERISEAQLRNGDRITIGDTLLLVQFHRTTALLPLQVVLGPEDTAEAREIKRDTRFLDTTPPSLTPDTPGQFSKLHEFMLDISAILHQDALLERAMEHFFTALSPDRCVILLANAEGQPEVKATKAREGLQAHTNISISRTMARHVLQKKESFVSINAAADARLAKADSIQIPRILSVMGAPLKVKDRMLGMVYADILVGGKAFSDQDLKLFTAMTLQLAICLEKTRLSTELLDATEFGNSVLRSLASGIVVVDGGGRILRTNRATDEILGTDERKLLGRCLKDIPDMAELNRIVAHTLTTARTDQRHEILVRSGKLTIPLGVTVSVLTDHTGKVAGAVANFRNLAAIRRLEEEVRRAQHLAGLGQMAAGVAHEIRNPLNSIRGFAQLLQELPAADKRQTEWCQIVLEEVDRMNAIVQDLLDFSRQHDLTLAPLQLPKLLESLTAEMQAVAQTSQVTLTLQPAGELPEVLGNKDKLRQVFHNIIINGIQACQAGGAVTVHFDVRESQVSPAEADSEQKASRREVAVVLDDTGCGMEPGVMAKIFEPFFTQKDRGTGLGLSICQRIVDQHEGRIEVQSEPGRGSTFTVLLPIV